ncbi:unnamed protein product [Echinostoma caproni]|uniref:OB_aCoA_assoc domain-containing protein n=1 Tax=Echinostoma caproni TaxID=27848 RepID=A0A183B5X9_9TREM|nr:unnamed protein product [Echinostoma caproni]
MTPQPWPGRYTGYYAISIDRSPSGIHPLSSNILELFVTDTIISGHVEAALVLKRKAEIHGFEKEQLVVKTVQYRPEAEQSPKIEIFSIQSFDYNCN